MATSTFTDAERRALASMGPGEGPLVAMVRKLQSLPRGPPVSAGGLLSKIYRMDLCHLPASCGPEHEGTIACILWHPRESDPLHTLPVEQQKAVGYSVPAVPIIAKEEYMDMTHAQTLNFLGQSLVGDIMHTFVDFRVPLDKTETGPLRGHEVKLGQAPEGFILHDLAIANAVVVHENITRYWADPTKKLFSIATSPAHQDDMNKEELARLVSFCSTPKCSKMGTAATLKRCSACRVAYYCSQEWYTYENRAYGD